jgi:hypothetical protein
MLLVAVYARLVAATRRISSVKLVDWQDSGKQKTYDVFHPLTSAYDNKCHAMRIEAGGSLGSVGVTVTGGGAFPTDGVTRPVPPISETYWIPSI